MNAAEFSRLAIEQLDKLDEAADEKSATEPRNAELFLELVERWRHAALGFPGMTWEEFQEISRKRTASRGRRKVGELEKAGQPMVRAARDVKRIRDMWRQISGSQRGIPIDAIEFAARRHGVDEAALGERVRRPLNRR